MGLRTAPLVAALLPLACYNYLPLARSHLTPATNVAITLTDAGTEALAGSLGPDVLVVRGRLLLVAEQGISMSVQAVESRRGDVSPWAGETVLVPAEFARAMDERQVARGKTVLLAGASLLGMVMAYQVFGSGASGGAPSGSGSGPSAR